MVLKHNLLIMKTLIISLGLVILSILETDVNALSLQDSIKPPTADTLKIATEATPAPQPDSTIAVPVIKEEPSKQEEAVVEKPDTIIKKSEFAIIGKVLEKNLYEVKYIKKGEKLERKMSTRELKAIHYGNGKTDLIDNAPEKAKKDWISPTAEVEWKKVKIAYEDVAVTGMILKDTVSAVYEAQKINMSNEVMERNAISIMQKKAFALKATAILIKTKEFKREYGEYPSIKMSAIAYSNQ